MASVTAISGSAVSVRLSLPVFRGDACVVKVTSHPSIANCSRSMWLVGNI